MGTLGDIQRALLDLAGRQAVPGRGRDALMAALDAGPGSVQAQLREIRGLLSPQPLINVRGLSDGALRKMHEAICEALHDDDRAPKGAKIYGVREFGDWRTWADLLEAELTTRNISFTQVDW